MAKGGTRPWESEYTVKETEVLAEVAELRAVRITLAPDDFVPWHWHSAVEDRFVCLEGALKVETRAPRETYFLAPGQTCLVPAKRAHKASNNGDALCRFLVIQGVGVYDFNPVGG